MMREKTCCFTGHRNIPSEITEELFCVTEKIVKNAIKCGYRYFGLGGALGFDTLSALVILKLKKYYPDIRLILVLPCLNQTQGWSKDNVELYEKISKKADKVVYTSQNYTSDCMHKRNRHLVDNSSLCICYLTENKGGTFYTVKYAREKGLAIVNIANYI
ncbi:MAG: SLOG family protein [Acutalibacteraceae bacterium]|nr:SLOG family protein [Acutalibacteraceae bacterium]